MLLDKGDYAGAEPMFRQSLAISRKHFGARHPSLWKNMVNLARALIDQQRYDEAAPLLTDGLALVTSTADVREDAAITRLSFQLARIHLARGDAAAAELLLRDVLTRQQAALPADDWLLAATRSALGASLIELKQLDEAERLLTEASAVLKTFRDARVGRRRPPATGSRRWRRRVRAPLARPARSPHLADCNRRFGPASLSPPQSRSFS